MKPKISRIVSFCGVVFVLSVSLINVFPKEAFASGCSVSVAWGDQSQKTISPVPTNVLTPQTYSTLVTFQNCIGFQAFVTLTGGSYGNGTIVSLGSKISQNPETRWASMTLGQASTYLFYGSASDGNDPLTPASSFSSNSSSISATAGAYACVASNGIYACSPSNSKDLHDVISSDGTGPNGCSYDYSSPENVALQINPSWCGCTNAQVQAGKTGTACQTSSSANTAPASGAGTGSGAGSGSSAAAATAMSVNSTTTLFNPLPEDDLIHVFLLVTQGFLSIMGVLATIFIIIGGFQLVIAAGNEEAITKGKKTITWAIIGLVVAILSFSIVAIAQDLLGASVTPPTTTSPQGGIPNANTPQGGIPNAAPQGGIPNTPPSTGGGIPN